MKRTLTTLLVAASLLTGAPGLAQAAPPPAPASATLSPQDRADLFRLGAASPSLLHQSAGDGILVVEDQGRRPRRDGYGYGYGYGYGIGSLILTALIVGVIVAGQQPRR